VTPYGTYSAKDGFIVLAVGSDAQFQRLLNALDRQHLATDERFATNAARIAHREELRELLQPVLRLSTAEELQSLLDAAEVPSAVVRSVSSALESPEAHNVGSATHPHYGEIRQVMSPIRFDGSYLTPYMAPPELGEHNKVVKRD
jgi:crotonobetainyl-CoA:carnitine CoA-transferase CaiB-like acyl-CoA transferase